MLTKLAVRIAAPAPRPEQYSRYLFIGPHPDDIEIGAGATAAKLAAEGKDICFLICTDGRFGDAHLRERYEKVYGRSLAEEEADAFAAQVAAIRERESIRSAAELGIRDVRFLHFSDGGFYSYENLLKAIAAVVSDFKPDIIFAPDPLSKSESHADHLNVGRAARQIACFAPYEGIMKRYSCRENAPVQAIAYYMTARPNRFVGTNGYLQKQLHALKNCHRSQYPKNCNKNSDEFSTIELYLKLRSLEFGLRSGHRCAEGFRVYGQTQMHCLPEAGE